MDGFTYTNLFETKGIEYLIIIGFFIVLIPFWLLLNRKAKVAQEIRRAALITANSLTIPQGLFFSKYHSWAFLEKNGQAKVGLDDLILQLTGEVQITHLKNPGEKIRKGEIMSSINHHGKSLNIHAPVSGEIMSSNELLIDSPAILRNDPYQRGWIYAIKPSDWKNDTNSCFLAEEAAQWANRELERVKYFLAASIMKYFPQPSGLVLQDGGELVDKPLADLPTEVWQDFQENFLN